MKNVLFLGSKSPFRKKLLEEALIPIEVVGQYADETVCDWGLSLPLLEKDIALHKMNHTVLPDGKQESDVCFVLTADTMSEDKDGVIHGKPVDKEDAIKKIKAARDGMRLCTAFCLDKKVWRNGKWELLDRATEIVSAEYVYYIPDEWIESYLTNSYAMQCSGAIAVDGMSGLFLKDIQGSYTAMVGLPLFEVHRALEKFGFFW